MLLAVKGLPRGEGKSGVSMDFFSQSSALGHSTTASPMMLALINVPYLHDRISKKKTHSSVGFDFISFVGNNKKALAAGRTLRDIWIFCCDGGGSKSKKKILMDISLAKGRSAEITIDLK